MHQPILFFAVSSAHNYVLIKFTERYTRNEERPQTLNSLPIKFIM
jgi:hypothetical protein